MRVLLLLPYAWDTSPSQRFRIEQWGPLLEKQGVELCPATLLNRTEQKLLHGKQSPVRKAAMLANVLMRRIGQLRGAGRYDAIWLHRAAYPIGPPFLERLLRRTGIPVIMEFDDAIYLNNTAASNARFSALKCAGKTAEICRLSTHVVVGNEYLADYARAHNSHVTIIPTTIDTDHYVPRREYRDASPVVIGWSGSATTVAHLQTVDRVLQRVAEQAKVRLHVMGTPSYSLAGVETRAVEWSPEVELPQLQEFDIGIMPLPDEEWARGKCALKALQYMAVGVPVVTSPVGVNAEIIRDGENGFLATTEDEWVDRLLKLVRSVQLRERVGRAGRATVLTEFSATAQAPRVLEVLRTVQRRKGSAAALETAS
ncbi:MAG: sugar transferase, PEP-CTERM/EpsH1 system associated [Armatimonadetes bacterium]|jgi:glycosyltransferase involved in cell wall biosynthesis|nr:sugar transferase, PEP-CTERM/EpsH1 system associated [Armatimonadota bacterium]